MNLSNRFAVVCVLGAFGICGYSESGLGNTPPDDSRPRTSSSRESEAGSSQRDESLTPVNQYDRVLCMSAQCELVGTGQVDGARRTIPFGTLLKVARVEGERCLVYNAHASGWVDRSQLASISDPGLLDAIARAPVSSAQKEYALGNYYVRRSLSQSARHFRKALQLDPQLDCAIVDMLFPLECLEDAEKVREHVKQLRRFPDRNDVVMAYQLHIDAAGVSESAVKAALPSAPFLQFAWAVHLLKMNDVERIPEAHRLAQSGHETRPFDPTRAYLLAQVWQVLIPIATTEEECRLAIAQAHRFSLRAIEADPRYWPAYENIAYIEHQLGRAGPAIRYALAALRTNPRALEAAQIIASYADRAQNGEVFADDRNVPIRTENIVNMPDVVRGLTSLGSVDVPGTAKPVFGRNLELHGFMPVPLGHRHDEQGRTALHIAIDDRNGVFLAYLAARYDIDWNVKDQNGMAAIHVAAQWGDVALLSALIGCGADVNVKTDGGKSLIDLCLATDDPGVLYRVIREDDLEDGAWADVRRHFKLPDDAPVSEIRRRVLAELNRDLEQIVSKQLEPLCRTCQSLAKELRIRKEQEVLESEVIPLDPEPILIPSELQSVARLNTGRFRALLFRRLVREVDEELALEAREIQWHEKQTEQIAARWTQTSKRAHELARAIILTAAWAMEEEALQSFRETTGRKIESLLESCRRSP